MITELFVLVREGVHMRQIIGTYTTKDKAQHRAVEALDKEFDEYHEYCVYKTTEDGSIDKPPWKVLSVRKDGYKIIIHIMEVEQELPPGWFGNHG